MSPLSRIYSSCSELPLVIHRNAFHQFSTNYESSNNEKRCLKSVESCSIWRWVTSPCCCSAAALKASLSNHRLSSDVCVYLKEQDNCWTSLCPCLWWDPSGCWFSSVLLPESRRLGFPSSLSQFGSFALVVCAASQVWVSALRSTHSGSGQQLLVRFQGSLKVQSQCLNRIGRAAWMIDTH